MSYTRTLLALAVLAAMMVVGCKEPVGLPNNRVRAATLDTLVINVVTTQYFTGDVHHKSTGNPIDGWYEINYQDTIKWGYLSNILPLLYDDWRGFATFSVPPFISDDEIPICTLHYYVAGCYEYQSDSILVNRFDPAYWTWNAASVFKAIDTSTTTLAKDASPTSTGWHKVALTTEGCGIIATVGAEAEEQGFAENLFTGWKYLDSPSNGWHTEVVGPDNSVSPYIVVIYTPEP
jgi:hypothetical protein